MHWMLLPLKRYADFRSRSRRKEFWLFALFMLLIYAVLTMAAGIAAGASLAGGASPVNPAALVASLGAFAVVMLLIWLATLIPSIAVSVRRLHDTGRSGWWLLIYIVPYILSTVASIGGAANQSTAAVAAGGLLSLIGFIGAVVLLVFLVLPGTRGMNRFGPDPKGPDLAETFG